MEHTRKEKRNVCHDLPECVQSGDTCNFGRQAASQGQVIAPVDNGVVGDELLELVEQGEMHKILFEDEVDNLDAEFCPPRRCRAKQ